MYKCMTQQHCLARGSSFEVFTLAEGPALVDVERTSKEASQVACRQTHAHVDGTQTDLQYKIEAEHTLRSR
jgi:hypothetical protein